MRYIIIYYKSMKKLIFFLIFLGIWINNTFSAVTVSNCQAPWDNLNWTKSVYSGGSGTTYTCSNHNYYTSQNFLVSWVYWWIKWDNFITECPLETYPYDFTQTWLTIILECKPIDDIPPTLSDIEMSPLSEDLLATFTQNITTKVSRNGPFATPTTWTWGSPIEIFEAEFENSPTPDTFFPFSLVSSFSSTCGAYVCDEFSKNDFNTSSVDNDRISWGGMTDEESIVTK